MAIDGHAAKKGKIAAIVEGQVRKRWERGEFVSVSLVGVKDGRVVERRGCFQMHRIHAEG